MLSDPFLCDVMEGGYQVRNKLMWMFLAMIAGMMTAPTVGTATETSGIGTATIKVSTADDALTLTEIPSFKFGTVKNNVYQLKAVADQAYTVVDLRGDDTGYEIQTMVSDFKQSDDEGNVLPINDFLISVEDSANGQLTGSFEVNVFKQAAKVATGSKDANGQIRSGKIDATMNLASHNDITTGTEYKATITHSLVAGIGN